MPKLTPPYATRSKLHYRTSILFVKVKGNVRQGIHKNGVWGGGGRISSHSPTRFHETFPTAEAYFLIMGRYNLLSK
jgi:hypothetical protein